MARDFIPPRDENFPRWQSIVARVVNNLSTGNADVGTRAVLPMVDGSIPPVFIQNPDGSLVYTEIE